MYKDLIICAQCGAQYGPTEVRRIIRTTCDRCGIVVDSECGQVLPERWSHVQQCNMLVYTLCPSCNEGLKAFCTGELDAIS